MRQAFINTIGMRMHPVLAGTFMMGAPDGHFLSVPPHSVTLSQPFWMAETPVTNAQYEQFDPAHRMTRSWTPFAQEDDDAALFISYQDAVRFARWLTQKEGILYDIPTEAQWEYAARAGGNGAYGTNESALDPAMAQNQRECWYPDIDHPHADDTAVRLKTGQGKPNAWGLHDMNGLVEEWCADRFTRYSADASVDPIGAGDSPFRMTRGGSHSTPEVYLRNDARMGTLDGDRSWYIGLRLCAMQEARIENPFVNTVESRLYAQDVSQSAHVPRAKAAPYFFGPAPFVKLEVDDSRYFFSHNHGPSVVECPNGDLLAAWFSCPRESGREMSILASRRRAGQAEWEDASVFLASPARNLSSTVLIRDGDVLLHFNGISACATWANVAIAIRSSRDNGATWSDFRIIQPRHDMVLMPCGNSGVVMPDGRIMLTADNISVDESVRGAGGSTVLYWNGSDTIDLMPGMIPGIHAPAERLENGSLLAFGRGGDIGGCMPMSRSEDGGRTFATTKSLFPGIGMGQRPVLKMLEDGVLFLASFASRPFAYDGGWHQGTGLFGALSYDGGITWPVVRAIVPDGAEGAYNGGAWTGTFQMDALHAEPKGYLSCAVGADGVIHLLSSGLEYALNRAWLER